MLLRRIVLWVFSIAPMVLGADAACSQAHYPNKPIRIVTPGTGGGTDLTARMIAPGLSGSLGQQVVVDNRPSGVIAGGIASKAQPDGYTLLIGGSSHWLAPFMQDNLPFDPVRDFSAITLAVSMPNILVVHPSVAANSVKELIALAKSRPGELNYASALAGGTIHLAAELFKAMAGVNIVRVPYKGSGPALNDLIAGQVQVMFATAGSVAPHIKSGRLRALAVTTSQPSALAPGLPAVAAAGLPGYESVAMFGMFAPARTPATIISRLHQEIVGVLNKADVKQRFFNVGVETVGSSPEEFAAAVKSEIARMGKVIKSAGIRAD